MESFPVRSLMNTDTSGYRRRDKSAAFLIHAPSTVTRIYPMPQPWPAAPRPKAAGHPSSARWRRKAPVMPEAKSSLNSAE